MFDPTRFLDKNVYLWYDKFNMSNTTEGSHDAPVAELADAPDLGSGIFDVQVRFLSGAPKIDKVRQRLVDFTS